jgi:hypothetical protein
MSSLIYNQEFPEFQFASPAFLNSELQQSGYFAKGTAPAKLSEICPKILISNASLKIEVLSGIKIFLSTLTLPAFDKNFRIFHLYRRTDTRILHFGIFCPLNFQNKSSLS